MAPVTEEISRTVALRERNNMSLKKESSRIKTFVKWPVPFLKASDLAKEGFYFTNVNDVVKCAFCKTEIGLWKEGDDPHRDHLKFSPQCPFLRNEPCGNVALTEEPQGEEEATEIESLDVCGITNPMLIRPFSGPERPNKDSFSIDSSSLWREFEALGVSKFREPVAPNFSAIENRLRTYEKWRAHEIQAPERLAEAGFYYTGEGDNVLCFHCGGGLKNWEKGEDPWVEHALWFHKCRFVMEQKGEEFIQQVLLKKKAFLTAEATREVLTLRKKDEVNNFEQSIDVVETVQSEPDPAAEALGADIPPTPPNSDVSSTVGEPETDDHHPIDEPVSQDVCGIYNFHMRPFSGIETRNENVLSRDLPNSWGNFEALGVLKIREPVALHYATFESRLRTFEKWRAHEIQAPEKLAEAGFYYTGEEDNVLCFHCGGGLKNWEKGEDPWVEHALWFHKCYFLMLQKGREFIRDVLLRRDTLSAVEHNREVESSESDLNRPEDIVERIPLAMESSVSEEPSSPSSSSILPNVQEPIAPRCDSKEIQLCRVCYTRERELVFLPCGHFVCCSLCTSSLTKCAVCRSNFQATVRAYLC